ncbi:MAG: hypothetical protein H0W08_24075 [Acidobacteria bacterium]|nr:hypothetical protein [Acidobacteriota bacterium]
MSSINRRYLIAFGVTAISCAGLLARPASAQERPAPVAELAAGALLFPDDGITVKEGLVGGTARFYVSPRLSVGPEVAYVRGDDHAHLMLTGNLTFDFLGPVNGQPRPVTPFVVVGAGLFRTREEFPGTADFTSSEGAFTAGGGVRAHVGTRMILGAEARIGWELHVRVNAIVGIRLGAM